MSTSLEVLFTPAESERLKDRDLREAVCVVFDVLRATSTMITALANGAAAIVPVAEIAEALEIRRKQTSALLAGERDGRRIPASLAGGVEFDLGNSPREFARGRINGRTVVMTTTNGTRAVRACSHAHRVFLGSFLNLRATANFLRSISGNAAATAGGATLGATPLGGSRGPGQLLLICGGTYDQAAYEDVLAAGALVDLLWSVYDDDAVADSARLARRLYGVEAGELARAIARSRNGRRLSAQPDLREDVPYCAQREVFDLVAELQKDGTVTVARPTAP